MLVALVAEFKSTVAPKKTSRIGKRWQEQQHQNRQRHTVPMNSVFAMSGGRIWDAPWLSVANLQAPLLPSKLLDFCIFKRYDLTKVRIRRGQSFAS